MSNLSEADRPNNPEMKISEANKTRTDNADASNEVEEKTMLWFRVWNSLDKVRRGSELSFKKAWLGVLDLPS